jgi:hypothetical protein
MRTILTIGKYSIPNRRLAILLDQTKNIHDNIGEGNGNSADIMGILNFKVKSPSYYTNMQDLRAFGLVQGQDKNIRITPLGLRAISEDTTQDTTQAVLEQVFDNFELWKKLRERFGNSVEHDTLSQTLAEITGAEPPDETTTESVRKAYLKDIQVLDGLTTKQENQDGTVSVVEVANKPRRETAKSNAPRNVIGYITFPEFSASPVQIKDELSYVIALKLLDAMGKRLEIDNKQVQTLLKRIMIRV